MDFISSAKPGHRQFGPSVSDPTGRPWPWSQAAPKSPISLRLTIQVQLCASPAARSGPPPALRPCHEMWSDVARQSVRKLGWDQDHAGASSLELNAAWDPIRDPIPGGSAKRFPGKAGQPGPREAASTQDDTAPRSRKGDGASKKGARDKGAKAPKSKAKPAAPTKAAPKKAGAKKPSFKNSNGRLLLEKQTPKYAEKAPPKKAEDAKRPPGSKHESDAAHDDDGRKGTDSKQPKEKHTSDKAGDDEGRKGKYSKHPKEKHTSDAADDDEGKKGNGVKTQKEKHAADAGKDTDATTTHEEKAEAGKEAADADAKESEEEHAVDAKDAGEDATDGDAKAPQGSRPESHATGLAIKRSWTVPMSVH